MTADAVMDIAWKLFDAHQYAWIPVLIYMIVNSFIFLNLFLSVMKDAVDSLHYEVVLQAMNETPDSSTVIGFEDNFTNVEKEIEDVGEQVYYLVKLHIQTKKAIDDLQNHIFDLTSHVLPPPMITLDVLKMNTTGDSSELIE
eukprot:CAMPEP_0194450788 /NCGR_PEP_ID=MMETSP0176-20130528/130929_1 /TAXON_ID=216777 /ORGANISM="Proboscia alata, Strain PI-D3" /LENGTH=141 /DNA_ID=CAMNT_0039278131 /DNA_START=529 /DNA_END=954 /DNA_ORIENTATION=-